MIDHYLTRIISFCHLYVLFDNVNNYYSLYIYSELTYLYLYNTQYLLCYMLVRLYLCIFSVSWKVNDSSKIISWKILDRYFGPCIVLPISISCVIWCTYRQFYIHTFTSTAYIPLCAVAFFRVINHYELLRFMENAKTIKIRMWSKLPWYILIICPW